MTTAESSFISMLEAQIEKEMTDRLGQTKRLTAIQDFLNSGIAKAYSTETHIITKDHTVYNGNRSNWYQMAGFCGLEKPAILSLTTPKLSEMDNPEENLEIEKEYLNTVKGFLAEAGLRPYLWTIGSRITLYLALKSDAQFLPYNINDPRELQKSVSGFTYNGSENPGKKSKALKVMAPAKGAYVIPRPSRWEGNLGHLELPNGEQAIIHCHDSQGAGDGGGVIRESFARKYLWLGGAEYRQSTAGVYTVIIGANYAVKAFLTVLPDSHFPQRDPTTGERILQDVDIIVDRDSMKEHLYNDRFTVVKILPFTQSNDRTVFVTPLIQNRVTTRFIDGKELCEVMPQLARKGFSQNWEEAATRDQSHKFQQELLEDADPDEARKISRVNDEKEAALLAYEETGGSIAASPSVMDRVVNKLLTNWRSHITRNQPAPSLYASGETVFAMHPFYAGVATPQRGYVRLVWDKRRPGRLTGVCFNPTDLGENGQALDTVDFDSDRANLIFMTSKQHGRQTLVQRSPQSIDGGMALSLYHEDAAKLQLLGYHFYQRTGGHDCPDLYKVDTDTGAEVYPTRTQPPKFSSPPKWTNRETNGLKLMVRLARQARNVAQATNLMYNLDYAGLFTPELKTRFSTDWVDPYVNGDRDTRKQLAKLTDWCYLLWKAGAPFDPCVSGRIKGLMFRHHQLVTGTPDQEEPTRLNDPPAMCGVHDQPSKDTCDLSLAELERLNSWAVNMANGPAAMLIHQAHPKVATAINQAFQARNRTWAAALRRKEQLRNQGLAWLEAKERWEEISDEAKDQEEEVIHNAFRTTRALPEYRNGDFVAVWRQLLLSRRTRFAKADEQRAATPINIHSLESTVSQTELQSYYRSGARKGQCGPTLVLRVLEEEDNLTKGKTCTISPDGSGWAITTPVTRKVLATTGPEARDYKGCKLSIIGILPNQEPVQDGSKIIALRVTGIGEAPMPLDWDQQAEAREVKEVKTDQANHDQANKPDAAKPRAETQQATS